MLSRKAFFEEDAFVNFEVLAPELPFPNKEEFNGAPGPSDPPAPEGGEEPMLLAGASMSSALMDTLKGAKKLLDGGLLEHWERHLGRLEQSLEELNQTAAAKADHADADTETSLKSMAGPSLGAPGHREDSLLEIVLQGSGPEARGPAAAPRGGGGGGEAEAAAEAARLEELSEQLRAAAE